MERSGGANRERERPGTSRVTLITLLPIPPASLFVCEGTQRRTISQGSVFMRCAPRWSVEPQEGGVFDTIVVTLR